jgi:hypothetical protein
MKVSVGSATPVLGSVTVATHSRSWCHTQCNVADRLVLSRTAHTRAANCAGSGRRARRVLKRGGSSPGGSFTSARSFAARSLSMARAASSKPTMSPRHTGPSQAPGPFPDQRYWPWYQYRAHRVPLPASAYRFHLKNRRAASESISFSRYSGQGTNSTPSTANGLSSSERHASAIGTAPRMLLMRNYRST